MTEPKHSRRRVLSLMAAGAAAAFAPTARATPLRQWTGTALGADARITIAGVSSDEAESHVAACLAEVERLETVFSLYRSDSEISRLNRDGHLARPSPELRQLIDIALAVHRKTDGRFDPAVESIWHQRTTACDMASLQRTFEHLRSSAAEIVMPDGMTLTFNGIAQGFITDAVSALMRRRGLTRILIDMGETRTSDDTVSQRPWTIALPDNLGEFRIHNGARATSVAQTLELCPGKGIAHIVDPRTSKTPQHWQSVTVHHHSATWADALSTALFLAAPHEIADIGGRFPGVKVWAASQVHSPVVFAT